VVSPLLARDSSSPVEPTAAPTRQERIPPGVRTAEAPAEVTAHDAPPKPGRMGATLSAPVGERESRQLLRLLWCSAHGLGTRLGPLALHDRSRHNRPLSSGVAGIASRVCGIGAYLSQGGGRRGTMMRYGRVLFGMSKAIPLLPESGAPSSFGALLVVAGSGAQALAPGDPGTAIGTVSLPPIAAAADPHLAMTACTVEETVALQNRRFLPPGAGQKQRGERQSPREVAESPRCPMRPVKFWFTGLASFRWLAPCSRDSCLVREVPLEDRVSRQSALEVREKGVIPEGWIQRTRSTEEISSENQIHHQNRAGSEHR